MYSQNYKSSTNNTHIVTFPNRESILRMQALNAKNEHKCEKQKENEILSITSDILRDDLLILTALLGISDDKKTNSMLFTLIAGILLTK